MFASNNGFHLGQHRMQSGKQTAYEEDIHVPLIVRGSGVPAGRTVSLVAGNVDLAPTFAQIGGVAAPAFVDGRSLVPLVGSTLPPANQWRQAYLIEHWPEGQATAADGSREPVDTDQAEAEAQPQRGRRGRGGRGAAPNAIPEFHALRTAQYIYVEYVTGEREVYDIARDPNELDNLASKTRAPLLQAFSDQLKRLIACSAAGCREADTR